jgi:diaminohydroxyphosphoribosylaminopyrimidine deaminase/5-amino-6-(5-phosphoribosylamino)uracil reductase
VTDDEGMSLAIAQAERARGTTAPNPAVGAVLVRDGRVIGAGHTQPVGGRHAEIMALTDAAANGEDPRGATLFVTLEPCCHHGRTPPCSDAVIAAGVARVVIGVLDRFPKVNGRSVGLLEAAGIDVRLGVAKDDCARLVRGFQRVITGGLPVVTAKVACSLDGRLATASGESQWITSEESRRIGHELRASHDAIVVGIGTVLADDPRLTVRGVPGADPVPVVLDSSLRVPEHAALFQSSRRPVIFCAPDAPERPLAADVIRVPRGPAGLDLRAVLQALGARGLHDVLVEGGGQVLGALFAEDLVDDLACFVAPMLIPGGRSWVGGPALAHLADAPRLGAPDVQAVGQDLLLRYRVRPLEEW